MTRVKFVNLDNEVFALFPDELYNERLYGKDQVMSYMRIGQHGAASRSFMRRKSVGPEKYASLKRELETIGYKLEVIS